MVSKRKSEIGEEASRNSALEKVPVRVGIDAETAGKEIDCSSEATFSAERRGETERSGTIWRGRKGKK